MMLNLRRVHFSFEELYDLEKHKSEEMLTEKAKQASEIGVKTVKKLLSLGAQNVILPTRFLKIMP